MNSFSRLLIPLLLGTGLIGHATPVLAQVDRVYKKSGESVAGSVTAVSSKGVQIKRGSNTEAFAAGDIEKVMYEGDPPSLTKAREFALDGQYEQALEELKKVDMDSIKRDQIREDVAFYIAFSRAKLSLAGKGSKNSAASVVMGFASKYKNSWHFFESARLLGDLALSLGDTKKALQFYGALGQAPSRDTRILAAYLQGMAYLNGDDPDKAMTQFDEVIGLSAETPATARTQILAKAGKAVALAKSDKSDEGLTLVGTLIEELNPADVEMASRIYNAQGASYEASGDVEGAILAYLHTHLMFSTQPDAHAEALLRLVELWPKVGKPDRAAQARQELQQRYPGVQ